ncbi:MAG: hypothetical protein R2850_12495 [Bacteroidia bacterium]
MMQILTPLLPGSSDGNPVLFERHFSAGEDNPAFLANNADGSLYAYYVVNGTTGKWR